MIDVHIYSPLPAMRMGIAQILGHDHRFLVHEPSEVLESAPHGGRIAADSTLIIDEEEAGIHRDPQIADLIRRLQGRTLIMSSVLEREHVSDVFASGVGGFIDRGAPASEILDATIRVSAGQTYLQPDLGSRLVGTADPRRSAGDPLTALSDREREVLRLLALGHKQREIARELTISVRTVETHLLHIRGKLNVSQRAELVSLALASSYFSLQREPPAGSTPAARRPFGEPAPVSGRARLAPAPSRTARGSGVRLPRPLLMSVPRYCSPQ